MSQVDPHTLGIGSKHWHDWSFLFVRLLNLISSTYDYYYECLCVISPRMLMIGDLRRVFF
jgi:hypothetical protein